MNNQNIAIFAAGCFWGVQSYFDDVPGVVESEVGYIGGSTNQPTYELVCSHTTGHAEAVRLVFDPAQVNYETLLRHFFRIHDPTQLNRQGPDVGDNYRSAIFYTSDEQRDTAEQVRDALDKDQYSNQIVTEISSAGSWWRAEGYHQKFAERTGQGTCHVGYKPL